MEIRPLTSDDAEAWWQLRLEMLRNDPESFADSVEEHERFPLEKARKQLAGDSAGNFVIGSFEDGRLIGTVGFFRRPYNKERHKGHIWGVYVQPGERGKGVARAMMEEVVRTARRIEGLEQITLVASAHLPARKLYEALGFESYGVEQRSLKIEAKYVDDVLMVLWL